MSAKDSSVKVGGLARRGFVDTAKASRLLDDPGLAEVAADPDLLDRVVDTLSAVADPDAGLLGLLRLAESLDPAARGELAEALGDEQPRERLLRVLGASTALADHLAKHPEQWRSATEPSELDVGQQARTDALMDLVGDRQDQEALEALRVGYRQQLLTIAAHDLTAEAPTEVLPEVAAALSDLAGAALQTGQEIARREIGAEADSVRLAVIGMGKAGGRELNYISDVDVIFVAEPVDGADELAALEVATRWASRLMHACSAATPEGSLWPVDAALRPEGKQGPLVRTVASHRTYYQRWAKTWEFQALLKARYLAGDEELAREYLDAVEPLVWEAASREDFVDDVQAMRRRVEDHIPSSEVGRQLKLGPGGLRDVEFSVQLLQLVHGRTDPSLRSRTTLEALRALSDGGYIARRDAEVFAESYRLLRTLEHRIQLHRMRRTHLMPTSQTDLRRLGRSIGLFSEPPVQVVDLRAERSREVRRLHERIFYRPLLSAVARLSADEARLTPEAARERLAALGYRDPAGALRHIEALTGGVSRTAAIQRQLLPVMLGWFGEQADPDAGLLTFRKVSEELGTSDWFLRQLRDEGEAAHRLACTIAASRFAGTLLLASPEGVRLLGEPDGLRPLGREDVLTRMRAASKRRAVRDDAVNAIRAIRRVEIFRIAAADLNGQISLEEVGVALSDLADATIEASLEVVTRGVVTEDGTRTDHTQATDVLIVGMGRLGGREMGYGSDADVLYVHQPREGADDQEAQRQAELIVAEMRRLMGAPGSDPPLGLDADLRPEGKNGPMVRSLASYAAYYERWSDTWEAQALLRARPVAGPTELGEEFVALIDPLRWPVEGLSVQQVRDIRRLKARMESERLPRSADRRTHFKLGMGGLTDVEWTVQLLQMEHGHETESLRTTQTLPALRAARTAGYLTESQAADLREAWSMASTLRNAGLLFRGRAVDSVPSDLRDADGMGRIVGLEPQSGGSLADSYRRVARRARTVTLEVFYGEKDEDVDRD